jgi:hypothetical protein
MAYIKYPDVLRTYDVSQLAVSTTMDRVASILPESEVLINCESLGAMAAGLGFSMGIMFPEKPELAAVRWHRIAPAFIGGTTHISDKILFDSFHFTEGSHWDPYLINKTIAQGAPAVISRNTELPKVECQGEPHFVVASLNPTGAYSVATLNRQLMGTTSNAPKIVCFVDSAPENIGFFGEMGQIDFRLSKTPKKVMLESLITRKTVDITAESAGENKITVSKLLLEKVFKGENDITVGNRLIVEY